MKQRAIRLGSQWSTIGESDGCWHEGMKKAYLAANGQKTSCERERYCRCRFSWRIIVYRWVCVTVCVNEKKSYESFTETGGGGVGLQNHTRSPGIEQPAVRSEPRVSPYSFGPCMQIGYRVTRQRLYDASGPGPVFEFSSRSLRCMPCNERG